MRLGRTLLMSLACSTGPSHGPPDGGAPDGDAMEADGPADAATREGGSDAGADAEGESEGAPGVFDWPMYGGGPAHTGYAPVTLGSADPALDWSTERSGYYMIQSPPVVQDGRVALLTYEASGPVVRVLDAGTGAEIWSASLRDAGGPISLDRGTLYVQESTGGAGTPHLWAFNATTGDPSWSVPIPSGVFGWSVPSGAFVYACTGPLSAFRAFDGASVFSATLWSSGRTAGPDGWAPGVEGSTAYAYTAGALWAASAATGDIVGSVDLPWIGPDHVNASVAVTGSTVYVASTPFAYAIDRSSLSVRWRHAGSAFTGTPVVANGAVYVRTDVGVLALDDASGRESWRLDGIYGINEEAQDFQQLIVTNDYLVVSTRYAVQLVSLATHAVEWDSSTVISEGGFSALTRDALYIAGRSLGDVHRFSLP